MKVIFIYFIYFFKSTEEANWLGQQLKAKNFDPVVLHGTLDPAKRDETMKKFAEGTYTTIIATNVIARGIDIPQVCFLNHFFLYFFFRIIY
jgi:superfamily II DNA/RNA helicase